LSEFWEDLSFMGSDPREWAAEAFGAKPRGKWKRGTFARFWIG
jgi:hypothetical protein